MNASQSDIKYNIRCVTCTIDCTWNLEEMWQNMLECWDVWTISGVVFKKMNASQTEIKYNIRCVTCTHGT